MPFGEQLISSHSQSLTRAVEDLHHARVVLARTEILERGADRKVGKAVAVEVASSKGVAELVPGLRRLLDPRGVLAEDAVTVARKAGTGAIDDVDGASARLPADLLTLNVNGEVGPTIAVEVPAHGAGRRAGR